MAGQPYNRAQGPTQHLSVHGIPTEMIRQIRVHAIIDNTNISIIVAEALELWLKEKEKKGKANNLR